MTELVFPAITESHRDSSNVARVAAVTPLVLSIFPGIDLLGRGFEEEGFCVVRGPDLLWGGAIETFHPAARFDGVIGGSPCQDFSRARRSPPTGDGERLLAEYARVVTEARPAWWLLENVPTVPDLAKIAPAVSQLYEIQRFDLNARECGSRQSRLRHFQFGSLDGVPLVLNRARPDSPVERICLASEGKRQHRRTWADFCELQGLPRNFTLPGYSVAARYEAVGNGVPIPMGRVIARAVLSRAESREGIELCVCNCGRIVTGRRKSATPACRKRLQRRRSSNAARIA